MKIDKEIRGKWLKFTLLNLVLIIVIFGILMGTYGYFVVDMNKKTTIEAMEKYADTLNSYSIDMLKEGCDSSNSDIAKTLNNPNFDYAIYTKRGDGSMNMLSSNEYLLNQKAKIGGKLGVAVSEKIGNYNFLTYTVTYNQSDVDFIKIFVGEDTLMATTNHIWKYSFIYIFIFIVASILISFLWGYIEIKPILKNYLEQKNFVNDMSHEIRTPLAIIKGNLENVQEMPDAKVYQVQENLNECVNEVDYMANMATGLLNIVRGENKSKKKDTKISDAIGEVVDVYSDLAAINHKSLIACIDTCEMVVDKDKIKQLVTILLDNSIKYTNDGDRITLKLKNTKEGCDLIVTDTGIGVKKENLENIFDRFYRADNGKDKQGTGLGLSIAKGIVDSMNGLIKAQCNFPNGLTIIVKLKREK